MGATSGPYGIRRMALQLEMEDGRLMTFYCSPENSGAAYVEITTETEPAPFPGHPLLYTRLARRIRISINDLAGYVMAVREPDPGHWEAIENRRELER